MRTQIFISFLATCALSACGGGGSSSSSGTSGSTGTTAPVNYTIGGTLNGLAVNEQIILNDNGTDPLTVAANGKFTFSTQVAPGGSYAASIATQPLAQTCTVASGSGSSIAADVGTVAVTCAPSTEKVLHNFLSGSQGASPEGNLIQGTDGNFYGTTVSGGTSTYGTVFMITPAGVLTQLHTFSNSGDGAYPLSGVVQGSDGNFYGTTEYGGTSNAGVVFKITPAGIETPIYSFKGGNDGDEPFGALVIGADGNFYGTTAAAGAHSNGTVFKITPAGVETVIYSFAGGSDGSEPSGTLVLGTDGNFYGTTYTGGTGGYGTVFKVTPAGVETVLYAFVGGSDAENPQPGLIQGTDGNFYGTSNSGGSAGQGTVYRVTPAGMEVVLYTFAGGTDASHPNASVIQGSDGNLYGVTESGGADGLGTIFRLTLSGTESLVYSFEGTTDGAKPNGGLLIGTDGHFYGTTNGGDVSTDYGTVYRF